MLFLTEYPSEKWTQNNIRPFFTCLITAIYSSFLNNAIRNQNYFLTASEKANKSTLPSFRGNLSAIFFVKNRKLFERSEFLSV